LFQQISIQLDFLSVTLLTEKPNCTKIFPIPAFTIKLFTEVFFAVFRNKL
jgi:hypothetical protein